jgi:hypothetical protein
MEMMCFWETSVYIRTTRRNIPEDGSIHNYSCGNLNNSSLRNAGAVPACPPDLSHVLQSVSPAMMAVTFANIVNYVKFWASLSESLYIKHHFPLLLPQAVTIFNLLTKNVIKISHIPNTRTQVIYEEKVIFNYLIWLIG